MLHTPVTNPRTSTPRALSPIDQLLANNRAYANARQHIPPSEAIAPPINTAIVTCMDCRIPIEEALGLKNGQAFVIRNAGNIVTEDVIRSLVLAVEAKDVQNILIIGHTDCALSKFNEDKFKTQLADDYKCAPCVPAKFHAFPNIRKNIRTQLAKLKAHPYLAKATTIRGFIFDVNTGKLRELTS